MNNYITAAVLLHCTIFYPRKPAPMPLPSTPVPNAKSKVLFFLVVIPLTWLHTPVIDYIPALFITYNNLLPLASYLLSYTPDNMPPPTRALKSPTIKTTPTPPTFTFHYCNYAIPYSTHCIIIHSFVPLSLASSSRNTPLETGGMYTFILNTCISDGLWTMWAETYHSWMS
jgi:hypothetical protein